MKKQLRTIFNTPDFLAGKVYTAALVALDVAGNPAPLSIVCAESGFDVAVCDTFVARAIAEHALKDTKPAVWAIERFKTLADFNKETGGAATHSLHAHAGHAATLVFEKKLSIPAFVSAAIAATIALDAAARATCLCPVVHVLDTARRKEIVSLESAMAHMELLRGAIDDLSLADMNTANIVRGWTVRREEKHAKPHTPKTGK